MATQPTRFAGAVMGAAVLAIAAMGSVCPPAPEEALQPVHRVMPEVKVDLAALVAAQPEEAKKPGPVLTGRIVDEHGKGLKGVKIQLYSGIATRWEGQSALTDADGTYRFDPMLTGAMMQRGEEKGVWDYYVGVRLEHPTHVSNENASWWDITVPSEVGRATTRDFTFVKGGIIRGVVQTYDGFPWREMAIRIHPLTPEHKGATGWYATTGKKGEFETLAMTPGEYAIQWNDNHSDYAELAKVKVQAGKVTVLNADVRVKLDIYKRSTEVEEMGKRVEDGKE